MTLNVRGEAPVLGFITGNAEAVDGTPDEPRCVLTELGKKVEEVWRTVTDFHPMCICDKVKAMPDISRETCMVMNELVRVIARKDDGGWK